MTTARYVMIGGFLGAGKTTTIARLARRLRDEGKRVGLVTNDQGAGLVDTRSLKSLGFAVEEIAGGCFCCRFDSLAEAARRLTETTRPDVFLAEPVGSCTDLVATVSYPLRRLYGDRYAVAPLSVVVDPRRALRVLGLRPGRSFSDKVAYLYRKQLEEAQVIAVNKRDATADADRRDLVRELAVRYPTARIFEVSARDGTGLDAWFDHLASAEMGTASPLGIDYGLYGEAEARLGWLNATLRLDAGREIDGNAWLADLARDLERRLAAEGVEVAHLKMTLAPESAFRDLAVVNLVSSELVPELGETLSGPISGGELVVNLRAEAPPEALREVFDRAVASAGGGVVLEVLHLECFRPSPPRPTHRSTC